MQLEWAENRLAEFKLWAATTGALAGDTASLDVRLITAPDTKNLVKGLLALLTQCLGKCKRLALPSDDETEEVTEELDEVGIAIEDDDESWANDVPEIDSAQRLDAAKDIPRGFSPWSDDSASNPESDSRSAAEDTSPLLEAKAEVEQIINHLARVALAIRKSGTSSRLHKADRTFDPSKHQNFRRHLELIILARGCEDGRSDYHLDTEALTAIQERLILANLRRRNRYRYAQKHADKLAVDSTINGTGAESAAVDVLTLRQNDSANRAPATSQIAESKNSPDLLDHIAEHLHNFALRSLPWLDNDPGDNEAMDPGDPYFNADDYFDQESENDSVQDVSVDSDRDSDGLASLSANSSDDDSVHDLRTEASPIDSEVKQRMDHMQRWLSPPDLPSDLVAKGALRHEYIETRLLESPPFVEWKSGQRRHLFVFAGAGFGKTVFMRTIFDHLRDAGSRPILAFFFKAWDKEKRTVESLIRSLAWQLYRTARAFTTSLDDLFTSHDKGTTPPDIRDLSVCVGSIIQSCEGADIIIDALDECTTRDELFGWLEYISSKPSFADTKIIVTGRPALALLNSVPEFFGAENCVALVLNDDSGLEHNKVARSYVNARLNQDSHFTTIPISEDILDEVRTRVGNTTDSM
ncbi:hypothetical protein CKAH01_12308 [Colletotrichum kahawae]|uniref:Nephrocystin 3-like N-terminal domain-containing protein n=1 Tax=Colletotrichum kahawae TaxID=34407 RepID=A0AAE0DCJ0_COLKA|nr:hypothetical protein CKAH01_12308 [Colletotrichum kahawae]